MKYCLDFRKIFLSFIFSAIFLLPKVSFAQPTFIGYASTPADGANSQPGPTVAVNPGTATPGTAQAGDLVIIYAQYRGNATLAMSALGGQTWNTETTYADNTSNISFGIFWAQFNGTWSGNPSVTSGAGNALTVVMYVFRPVSSSSTWGIHIAASNNSTSTSPYSITGVTTTAPNTITMAFWASGDDNTWGNLTGAGWSKANLNGQYRNRTGNDQSISSAYNIRSTTGATGNVSQTQTANGADFTRTSIISWYEIPTPPPANDDCSSAIPLTSSPTCSNTVGTLAGATYTAIAGACGSSQPDVWYSFTAKSTNPTINVSSGPSNSRFQVYSGTCGSPTSVFCSSSASQTVTGLTIGTTYLVRVYSNTGASGTFNICITDPAPANDLCSGVVTLTPALTCSNTSGNFYASTVSASPTITGSCAGSVVYDMWYSFVAPSANVTINMSNVGTDITSPGLELLSGDCSSMYSLACGTSSIAASGLIPGNTYYVRTYSAGGSAPTSATNAGFDICITYSAPPPPPNDECSGAIDLPVNSGCSSTSGTVNSATLSTGIPTSCTGPAAYDVWYKFTAVDVNETITTSSFGSGFAGTRRMELYSGSCGSLTSIGCGTTSITSSSLTVGNTYYVRVYTTTGPAPTAFGDFKVCVSTTASTPPRIGNSYVNISKNTTGGVVQNGDTLEIRMTIIVSSGTVYKTRYLDNVPSQYANVIKQW